MGGYIRIDKDQPTDTRLLDLADRLADTWQVSVIRGGKGAPVQAAQDLSDMENCHALRNALLGALVTLWSYADTHVRRDNTLPVTLSGLAPIVGLPVTVLEKFPPCWLIERKDGTVELPGYCEKNNLVAKDIRRTNAGNRREHERALARERQRRHREKQNGVTVTSRNGRDARDETVNTGTGTGPLDRTVPGAAPRAADGAAAAPRQSFEKDFEQRFGKPLAELARKVPT